MMYKKDEYFPTLKRKFVLSPVQCNSCKNYFKHEIIWNAFTLPISKDGEYKEYHLCKGCAKDKKSAVKYFKKITEDLQMA